MSSLEKTFELSKRGSTVRQEIIAGLTTFLAMVYSVIVVPKMLGDAGFPAESVFIATCLVAGLGSILIGFWANAPMAIGCAISLTAFTAFSLVIGQHVSIPVALGAVIPHGFGVHLNFGNRYSFMDFYVIYRQALHTVRGSGSAYSYF